MSIRFRTVKAGSKAKDGSELFYGAVVLTCRDKSDGKVRTKSLKTYGALTADELNAESFKAQVEADLAYFKAQESAGGLTVNGEGQGALLTEKLPLPALPGSAVSCYAALALYRRIWEEFGLNAAVREIMGSAEDETAREFELICFYCAALAHFEPDFDFDNRRSFDAHLVSLEGLNFKRYCDLLRLLGAKKQSLFMKLRRHLINPGSLRQRHYSFYLTKYYFIDDDKTLARGPQELQAVLGKLYDDDNVPIDYCLLTGELKRRELFDKLAAFEERYNYLREAGSKLTVFSDSELNNKRSLFALAAAGCDYVLIRNMYKFSRKMQAYLLDDQKFRQLYNHQGQTICRYKEFMLPLSLRENVNGTLKVRRQLTRIIVVWSQSKRDHDLGRLKEQWDVASEVVRFGSQYSPQGRDYAEISEHYNQGVMQFIRKKSDLKGHLELDINTYKDNGSTAGYFVIATSLDTPLPELYKQIKALWQDKEQYRRLRRSEQEGLKHLPLKDELSGHFVLCHLALLLQNLMLLRLKERGLNLSSKGLRQLLHECLLTALPAPLSGSRSLFLKSILQQHAQGTDAQGRALSFDELCRALQLEPINVLEDAEGLRRKLGTALPLWLQSALQENP